MSEELKPCPFCGQEEFDEGEAQLVLDGGGHWNWIRCRVCEAEGSALPSEQQAREAWNRRAQGRVRQVKKAKPAARAGKKGGR